MVELSQSVAAPPRQERHDLVIGGHLRPDKADAAASAAAADVRFLGRRQRLVRGGGRVWQHLRSFRKHLFEGIHDRDLRHAAACDNLVWSPPLSFLPPHAAVLSRCGRRRGQWLQMLDGVPRSAGSEAGHRLPPPCLHS